MRKTLVHFRAEALKEKKDERRRLILAVKSFKSVTKNADAGFYTLSFLQKVADQLAIWLSSRLYLNAEDGVLLQYVYLLTF